MGTPVAAVAGSGDLALSSRSSMVEQEEAGEAGGHEGSKIQTAQDAVKIRRLEKQREGERRKTEELKNKSADGQPGLLQLGSSTSEILETAFKKETVGLVTREGGMEEVLLPAFLKDLLGSPSASGKTAASARRLARLAYSKLFSSASDDDSSEDSSDDDAAATDRSEKRDLLKHFSEDLLDVLDMFDEPTKVSLLKVLTDDVGEASRTSGCWVSKADADAVKVEAAMPGLGKEHVKVRVEKDALVIEGKGDKDSEGGGNDDKGPARYSYCIEGFSSQKFKMGQIKAEMKNGLLSLTVPKIKLEDRKDVFQVKVE